MRAGLGLVVACCLGLLWTGCAGNGGGGDGGPDGDGAPDGFGDSGDQCLLPDLDLDDDLGLWVPEGLQACSHGPVFPESLASTFEMLGRVTFKAGLVRLPRDATTISADLVERVEWNREPQQGVPAGPGEFTRVGDEFTFRQLFTFGSRIMELTLRAYFGEWSSQPPTALIALDSCSLLNGRVSIEAAIDPASLYFLPCTYELYGCGIFRYTLEGGDTLTLEACSYCGGEMACKSSMGGIPRAEVILGGQTRVVTDAMQLALQFGQHDWTANALVWLREPLAGTAALVLSCGGGLQGAAGDGGTPVQRPARPHRNPRHHPDRVSGLLVEPWTLRCDP